MNFNEFEELRKEFIVLEENREKVIQLSRKIIKESKVIIYEIQRGNQVSLERIKDLVDKLGKDFKVGLANVALQEYVEALAFYYYVQEKRLVKRSEVNVNLDNYLLGLCDFVGELVRKAVKDAIDGNKDSVLEITKFVEEIYGEFIKFDFRNGELRKKSDSLRWNLQKLENLALGLK